MNGLYVWCYSLVWKTAVMYLKLVMSSLNFMVTPCISNIQHFNNQLTHTTLQNVELLKHLK